MKVLKKCLQKGLFFRLHLRGKIFTFTKQLNSVLKKYDTVHCGAGSENYANDTLGALGELLPGRNFSGEERKKMCQNRPVLAQKDG